MNKKLNGKNQMAAIKERRISSDEQKRHQIGMVFWGKQKEAGKNGASPIGTFIFTLAIVVFVIITSMATVSEASEATMVKQKFGGLNSTAAGDGRQETDGRQVADGCSCTCNESEMMTKLCE